MSYLAATAAVATTAIIIVVATATAEDKDDENNPNAIISAKTTVVKHKSFLLSFTLHTIEKRQMCYRFYDITHQ